MLRKNILLISILFLLFSCEKNQTQIADDLFRSGSYSEAITAYTTYIQDHPNDEKSLYNRGRAYEEIGELKSALKDFRDAVEAAPENIQMRQSLGLCYYKLEQYNSTISSMDDLLKQKPNDTEAFHLKARAQQKLGKLSDAIENYSNAIRYNSRHKESYLHRGMIFAATKKVDKACRDLRKAKALGAEDADKLIRKNCR